MPFNKNYHQNAPDLPNYEKSFSESEAIEFIQRTMAKLKELQGTSDYTTISILFARLEQSYYDLENYKISINKELIKRDYVKILSTYLNRFKELGYFCNYKVWQCACSSLSGLWNYSDASQEIANQILKTDLPKLLMDIVFHKSYIHNLQNITYKDLIKASLSIIHNIVRHQYNENIFNNAKLKKVLVELVRSNESDDIGILSLMIISYLVDKTQLNLLAEGGNITKAIINKIKLAFKSTSKCINGFSIWELVNGLRHISANDTMKKCIVMEQGIELMLDILKEPSCDEDIEKCLGVLWNLCFDKNIRSSLINDFNLRDVIMPFEHHKVSKIRKCCEGIIWLIDDKVVNKQLSVELLSRPKLQVKFKFDAFISYSWANKTIILSIRKELLKANLRLWIDVDQMKGSTLEAMADGIENSHLFIMAISTPYKSRPNCRTEAEYAFRLKKTIIPIVVESRYEATGWLGIILGNKIYYDFSGRRMFSESFRALLKAIKGNLRVDEETILQDMARFVKSDAGDSAVNNSTKAESKPGIHKWSNKDVANWLVENGLSNFKSIFSGVDGKLLQSMIIMNSKAPDFFFATLQNEYGMKLFDILQLDVALRELNL